MLVSDMTLDIRAKNLSCRIFTALLNNGFSVIVMELCWLSSGWRLPQMQRSLSDLLTWQ